MTNNQQPTTNNQQPTTNNQHYTANLTPGHDNLPELLKKLKEVLPSSYFSEKGTKLNLNFLKDALGQQWVVDKFGLTWSEQTEEFDINSRGKIPLLSPVADCHIESKTPTSGQDPHILIKGDNYHALTALQLTHKNKIDVIYIDPPYNTGKEDFTYNDNFVKEEDGFRHSKWLSFMHKRLVLAKDLLTAAGVVFISIDENERANLELLGKSIFPRFLGELIWDKRSQKGGAAAISTSHEHILVFANSEFLGFNEVPKPNAVEMHKIAAKCVKANNTLEEAQREFNKWLAAANVPPAEAAYNHIEILTSTENVKKIRLYRGTSLSWPQPNKNGYRYSVLHPSTKLACVIPDKGLLCTESTFREWDLSGKILYGKDHSVQPQKKLYLDENLTEKVRSIFVHSKGGVSDLRDLNCGLDSLFSYPKPLGLIKHLLSLLPADVVVLDFFAGSGTTGHAVMALNAEDKGTRQCILVTNDEGVFKDARGTVLPGGICTNVTRPRLNAVIQGYITSSDKVVAGLPGSIFVWETVFADLPNKYLTKAVRSFVANYASYLAMTFGGYTLDPLEPPDETRVTYVTKEKQKITVSLKNPSSITEKHPTFKTDILIIPARQDTSVSIWEADFPGTLIIGMPDELLRAMPPKFRQELEREYNTK